MVGIRLKIELSTFEIDKLIVISIIHRVCLKNKFIQNLKVSNWHVESKFIRLDYY